jgi:glycosyltransferase involved in cell wall biosynthesis
MTEKSTILFIADHPLVPSGVGTQAKYLIEGLLATGKYKFYCVGGAIKHPDYRIQRVEPEKYGDDWIIHPVDGFGDKMLIRRLLEQLRPKALLMFQDPRFFVWLWEMEDEIRSVCPMVYWHVWDNDPTPRYNKVFYESTDKIVPLSLKTNGILQDFRIPDIDYVPHAIHPDLFKPLPEEEIQHYKRQHFGVHSEKKFVLFWNNRNARRKMTGDVIASFAKFAAKVGKKNTSLMMHTLVSDQEGQNIIEVARCYDVEDCLIVSEQRLKPEELNWYYNVVDCTINIANNEGFGLGTLESLMAGTPIVVQMTGGLQFQIGDWYEGITDFRDQEKLSAIASEKWKKRVGNWWGAPVFPAARSCTGSQPIPYIYDDRVNHDDVVEALMTVYEAGRAGRRELGLGAREWAKRTFDLNTMVRDWDRILQEQIRLGNRRPPFRVVAL